MDDLLKGYSRKRREQAEPGFELHPATRRMLQSEVTRTFGQAETKRRSGWRSPWWWRGLALAAGLAGVWIVLLQIQMPTPKSQSLEKLGLPHDMPTAATHAAKDRSTVSPVDAIEAPTRSVAQRESPLVSAPVAAPAAPAVAVAAPASSGILLDEGAVGDKLKEIESTAEAKKNTTLDTIAVTNAPQTATLNFDYKLPSEAAGRFRMVKTEEKKAQQFVQFDNRARFRENVLSPPLPKVLTAFELSRDGNKVRITDADGSIYDGEVVKRPVTKAALGGISKVAALSDKKSAEATTNGTYAFRVSGLNRNLKQKVVFTGDVLEGSASTGQNVAVFSDQAAAASRPAPWGNAENQQSFRNNSLTQNQSVQNQSLGVNNRSVQNQPFVNQASVQNNLSPQNAQSFQSQTSVPNFRCEGRVRVGSSSEFQIEAVPVP